MARKFTKSKDEPANRGSLWPLVIVAAVLLCALGILARGGGVGYGTADAVLDIGASTCVVFCIAFAVTSFCFWCGGWKRSDKRARGTPQQKLAKLLLSSTLAAATYGLAECRLSILWLNGSIEPGTFWVSDNSGKPSATRFDAIRGYRIDTAPTRWACMGTDGTVQTIGQMRGNSEGFPDRDNFGPVRPLDRGRRFAVFGDSFTAAQYLQENWPDKVEDLSLEGDRLQLLNFAVDGAGLANWWSILTRYVEAEQYEVDGLIFAVFGDDLWRPFYVRDDSVTFSCQSHKHRSHLSTGWQPEFFPEKLEQCRDSMIPVFEEYVVDDRQFEEALAGEWRVPHQTLEPYLLGKIRLQLNRWRYPISTVAPPYLPDQRQMILDIRRYADANQLPILVVHVPAREAILYNQQHPYAVQDCESFANLLGAEFVNGTEAFAALNARQRREAWLPYDAHWGQAGSDRFAQFVLSRLQHWPKQTD